MNPEFINLVVVATLQTLYAVGAAAALSVLFGLPLGAFLATSAKGGLFEARRLNGVLEALVNAARSTPFLILAVALIPLTRLMTGTSMGETAAIVPLTIAAAPFVAKVVADAIRDVDEGIVEASRAMGATRTQIVVKVLLPEARPAILAGLTAACVSLLGNAAIVGAVGGGGIGDLGIRYGYQNFTPEVMGTIVAVLVVLVLALHAFGERLARGGRS